MSVLDKITIEEAKKIIPDKDIVGSLGKSEPIFRIVSSVGSPSTDDLVDVEIALRQCERTGFFRKQS